MLRKRQQDPHQLSVAMTGVKMGERLLQVGCAHPGRLGAIAARVGLSGQANAAVPDETSAGRARKGAADAGALVDVDLAAPTRLPYPDDNFDVAVVDDTGGLLGGMTAEDRVAAMRELARVLRPGGRVLLMGSTGRSGLFALVGGGAPSFTATPKAITALEADGFRSARVVGEREGLIFVEAVKARGDRAEG